MAIVKDNEDDSVEIDTDKCEFCKGNSSELRSGPQSRDDLRYLTSKEWCAKYKTCAATIDWDKVFNREHY